MTQCSSTDTGVLGSGGLASVDGRGLVTPRGSAASLDWWVRGPGGWTFPSRSGDTVQERVGDAPVVQTRVAGVTQTVYAAAGNPPSVVVSFENTTDAPVGLALAVVPATSRGVGGVARVEARGSQVSVDGAPFLALPGTDVRYVATGDLDSTRPPPVVVTDPEGRAALQVVVALQHLTPLSVVVGGAAPVRPVPSAADVARGWATLTQPAATFALPSEKAVTALRCAVADLLLDDPLYDPLRAAALCRVGLSEIVGGELAVRGSAPARVAAEYWRVTRDHSRLGESDPATLEASVGPFAPSGPEADAGGVRLQDALLTRGAGALALLLDAASPTLAWPDRWNPRSRGGCGVNGHDRGVSAAFVLAVIDACVSETGDGLALFPALPDEWRGSDVRFAGLATPYGRLDAGLAYKGDVAVLQWRGLWGARKPCLTAPATAPGWSTREEAGSVRLS